MSDDVLIKTKMSLYDFQRALEYVGYKPVKPKTLESYFANFIINDMKGIRRKMKLAWKDFIERLSAEDTIIACTYAHYGIISRQQLRDMVQRAAADGGLREMMEKILIPIPAPEYDER